MKLPARARRPIRSSALPAAGMLALLLAGCGDDSGEERAGARAQSAAKAATVQIRAFEFGPPALTVGAGAKVTFVNRDKAPHTAQTDLDSRASKFDTGRLERGGKTTVTLREPGRFRYFCAFHPFMDGTVTVVE